MKRPILKTISLILVGSFLLQDLSFGAENLSNLFFQLPKIDIPKSVGMVQESRKASPRTPNSKLRTIILVEDAHVNVSAQLNIAKILEAIIPKVEGGRSKVEGKSTYVFLEAGTGNDSLSYLRQYGTANQREIVAKKYLNKGYVQGADYLDLTSDLNFVLWGVEDKKLYNEGLKIYAELIAQREKLNAYLARVQKTIDILKPKIFNPSLQILDQKKKDYDAQKISLTEYFEYLVSQAGEIGVGARRAVPLPAWDGLFPNLKVLKDLKAKEAAIDFKKASEEQVAAIGSLSMEDQKELEEYAKNNPGRLNSKEHREQSAFYALLEEKLTTVIARSPKDDEARLPDGQAISVTDGLLRRYAPRNDGKVEYPELSKYFDYLKTSESLEAQHILEELETFREIIFNQKTKSLDEQRLCKADEAVGILTTLFNQTLTPKDFQKIKDNAHVFDITNLTAFLNRKIMDIKSNYEDAVFLKNEYEEVFKKAQRFYELTYERDEAFLKNTLAKMNEEKLDTAVLITGGYHSQNLRELFKKNDISYIVITPQVATETNQEKYEKILLGQQTADDRRQTVDGRQYSVDRDDQWSVLPAAEAVTATGARLTDVIQQELGPAVGAQRVAPVVEGARLAALPLAIKLGVGSEELGEPSHRLPTPDSKLDAAGAWLAENEESGKEGVRGGTAKSRIKPLFFQDRVGSDGRSLPGVPSHGQRWGVDFSSFGVLPFQDFYEIAQGRYPPGKRLERFLESWTPFQGVLIGIWKALSSTPDFSRKTVRPSFLHLLAILSYVGFPVTFQISLSKIQRVTKSVQEKRRFVNLARWTNQISVSKAMGRVIADNRMPTPYSQDLDLNRKPGNNFSGSEMLMSPANVDSQKGDKRSFFGGHEANITNRYRAVKGLDGGGLAGEKGYPGTLSDTPIPRTHSRISRFSDSLTGAPARRAGGRLAGQGSVDEASNFLRYLQEIQPFIDQLLKNKGEVHPAVDPAYSVFYTALYGLLKFAQALISDEASKRFAVVEIPYDDPTYIVFKCMVKAERLPGPRQYLISLMNEIVYETEKEPDPNDLITHQFEVTKVVSHKHKIESVGESFVLAADTDSPETVARRVADVVMENHLDLTDSSSVQALADKLAASPIDVSKTAFEDHAEITISAGSESFRIETKKIVDPADRGHRTEDVYFEITRMGSEDRIRQGLQRRLAAGDIYQHLLDEYEQNLAILASDVSESIHQLSKKKNPAAVADDLLKKLYADNKWMSFEVIYKPRHVFGSIEAKAETSAYDVAVDVAQTVKKLVEIKKGEWVSSDTLQYAVMHSSLGMDSNLSRWYLDRGFLDSHEKKGFFTPEKAGDVEFWFKRILMQLVYGAHSDFMDFVEKEALPQLTDVVLRTFGPKKLLRMISALVEELHWDILVQKRAEVFLETLKRDPRFLDPDGARLAGYLATSETLFSESLAEIFSDSFFRKQSGLEFSLLENTRRVMQSGFNVLFGQVGVAINDFLGGLPRFQELENDPNHHSRSFKTGLAVADVRINRDVPQDRIFYGHTPLGVGRKLDVDMPKFFSESDGDEIRGGDQWRSRPEAQPPVSWRKSDLPFYASLSPYGSAQVIPMIRNKSVDIINDILSKIESILPNAPPTIQAIKNAWNSVKDVFDIASSLFSVQKLPLFIRHYISQDGLFHKIEPSHGRRPADALVAGARLAALASPAGERLKWLGMATLTASSTDAKRSSTPINRSSTLSMRSLKEDTSSATALNSPFKSSTIAATWLAVKESILSFLGLSATRWVLSKAFYTVNSTFPPTSNLSLLIPTTQLLPGARLAVANPDLFNEIKWQLEKGWKFRPDAELMKAFAQTDRRHFLPSAKHPLAELNKAIDTADGQTNTQPSLTAWMILNGVKPLLEQGENPKILIIGTNTGYAEAVLARYLENRWPGDESKVYSVDILEKFVRVAQVTLEKFVREGKVSLKHQPEELGWPEESPFDAILVYAATDSEEALELLAGQLKPDGRLVVPWTDEGGQTTLQVLRRKDASFRLEPVEWVVPVSVNFVPLLLTEQGLAKTRAKLGARLANPDIWEKLRSHGLNEDDFEAIEELGLSPGSYRNTFEGSQAIRMLRKLIQNANGPVFLVIGGPDAIRLRRFADKAPANDFIDFFHTPVPQRPDLSSITGVPKEQIAFVSEKEHRIYDAESFLRLPEYQQKVALENLTVQLTRALENPSKKVIIYDGAIPVLKPRLLSWLDGESWLRKKHFRTIWVRTRGIYSERKQRFLDVSGNLNTRQNAADIGVRVLFEFGNKNLRDLEPRDKPSLVLRIVGWIYQWTLRRFVHVYGAENLKALPRTESAIFAGNHVSAVGTDGALFGPELYLETGRVSRFIYRIRRVDPLANFLSQVTGGIPLWDEENENRQVISAGSARRHTDTSMNGTPVKRFWIQKGTALFVSLLVRLAGETPMPLEKPESTPSAKERILARLREPGTTIGIFPAGRADHTATENMQHFGRREGDTKIAEIAVAADVPIVPFTVRGNFGHKLSAWKWLIDYLRREKTTKKRKLSIYYGTPIYPRDANGQSKDPKVLTQEMKDAILELDQLLQVVQSLPAKNRGGPPGARLAMAPFTLKPGALTSKEAIIKSVLKEHFVNHKMDPDITEKLANTLTRMRNDFLGQLVDWGVLLPEEKIILEKKSDEDLRRYVTDHSDLVNRLNSLLESYKKENYSPPRQDILLKRLIPVSEIKKVLAKGVPLHIIFSILNRRMALLFSIDEAIQFVNAHEHETMGRDNAWRIVVGQGLEKSEFWVREAKKFVRRHSKELGGDSVAWIVIISHGLDNARNWMKQTRPLVKKYQSRVGGKKTAWRILINQGLEDSAQWVDEAEKVVAEIEPRVGGKTNAWDIVMSYGLGGAKAWVARASSIVDRLKYKVGGEDNAWRIVVAQGLESAESWAEKAGRFVALHQEEVEGAFNAWRIVISQGVESAEAWVVQAREFIKNYTGKVRGGGIWNVLARQGLEDIHSWLSKANNFVAAYQDRVGGEDNAWRIIQSKGLEKAERWVKTSERWVSKNHHRVAGRSNAWRIVITQGNAKKANAWVQGAVKLVGLHKDEVAGASNAWDIVIDHGLSGLEGDSSWLSRARQSVAAHPEWGTPRDAWRQVIKNGLPDTNAQASGGARLASVGSERLAKIIHSGDNKVLPQNSLVIIFSPHPDDDVLGMGVTIRKLLERGNEVYILYATSGEGAVWHRGGNTKFLEWLKKDLWDAVDSLVRAKIIPIDPTWVEKTKDRIRREEMAAFHPSARAPTRRREAQRAARVLAGRYHSHLHLRFLNLPFYESRAEIPAGQPKHSSRDVQIIKQLLKKVRKVNSGKPLHIFYSDEETDPHRTHAVVNEIMHRAIWDLVTQGVSLTKWGYRGAYHSYPVADPKVGAIVPATGPEWSLKLNAIWEHLSQIIPMVAPWHDKRFDEMALEMNVLAAKELKELDLAGPSTVAAEVFARTEYRGADFGKARAILERARVERVISPQDYADLRAILVAADFESRDRLLGILRAHRNRFSDGIGTLGAQLHSLFLKTLSYPANPDFRYLPPDTVAEIRGDEIFVVTPADYFVAKVRHGARLARENLSYLGTENVYTKDYRERLAAVLDRAAENTGTVRVPVKKVRSAYMAKWRRVRRNTGRTERPFFSKIELRLLNPILDKDPHYLIEEAGNHVRMAWQKHPESGIVTVWMTKTLFLDLSPKVLKQALDFVRDHGVLETYDDKVQGPLVRDIRSNLVDRVRLRQKGLLGLLKKRLRDIESLKDFLVFITKNGKGSAREMQDYFMIGNFYAGIEAAVSYLIRPFFIGMTVSAFGSGGYVVGVGFFMLAIFAGGPLRLTVLGVYKVWKFARRKPSVPLRLAALWAMVPLYAGTLALVAQVAARSKPFFSELRYFRDLKNIADRLDEIILSSDLDARERDDLRRFRFRLAEHIYDFQKDKKLKIIGGYYSAQKLELRLSDSGVRGVLILDSDERIESLKTTLPNFYNEHPDLLAKFYILNVGKFIGSAGGEFELRSLFGQGPTTEASAGSLPATKRGGPSTPTASSGARLADSGSGEAQTFIDAVSEDGLKSLGLPHTADDITADLNKNIGIYKNYISAQLESYRPIVDEHRGIRIYRFEFPAIGNVYALGYKNDGGEDRFTLIDGSSGLHFKAVDAALRRAGVTPDKVERILVTHADRDHFSGAALYADKYGKPLFMHRWSRGKYKKSLENPFFKYITSAFLNEIPSGLFEDLEERGLVRYFGARGETQKPIGKKVWKGKTPAELDVLDTIALPGGVEIEVLQTLTASLIERGTQDPTIRSHSMDHVYFYIEGDSSHVPAVFSGDTGTKTRPFYALPKGEAQNTFAQIFKYWWVVRPEESEKSLDGEDRPDRDMMNDSYAIRNYPGHYGMYFNSFLRRAASAPEFSETVKLIGRELGLTDEALLRYVGEIVRSTHADPKRPDSVRRKEELIRFYQQAAAPDLPERFWRDLALWMDRSVAEMEGALRSRDPAELSLLFKGMSRFTAQGSYRSYQEIIRVSRDLEHYFNYLKNVQQSSYAKTDPTSLKALPADTLRRWLPRNASAGEEKLLRALIAKEPLLENFLFNSHWMQKEGVYMPLWMSVDDAIEFKKVWKEESSSTTGRHRQLMKETGLLEIYAHYPEYFLRHFQHSVSMHTVAGQAVSDIRSLGRRVQDLESVVRSQRWRSSFSVLLLEFGELREIPNIVLAAQVVARRLEKKRRSIQLKIHGVTSDKNSLEQGQETLELYGMTGAIGLHEQNILKVSQIKDKADLIIYSDPGQLIEPGKPLEYTTQVSKMIEGILHDKGLFIFFVRQKKLEASPAFQFIARAAWTIAEVMSLRTTHPIVRSAQINIPYTRMTFDRQSLIDFNRRLDSLRSWQNVQVQGIVRADPERIERVVQLKKVVDRIDRDEIETEMYLSDFDGDWEHWQPFLEALSEKVLKDQKALTIYLVGDWLPVGTAATRENFRKTFVEIFGYDPVADRYVSDSQRSFYQRGIRMVPLIGGNEFHFIRAKMGHEGSLNMLKALKQTKVWWQGDFEGNGIDDLTLDRAYRVLRQNANLVAWGNTGALALNGGSNLNIAPKSLDELYFDYLSEVLDILKKQDDKNGRFDASLDHPMLRELMEFGLFKDTEHGALQQTPSLQSPKILHRLNVTSGGLAHVWPILWVVNNSPPEQTRDSKEVIGIGNGSLLVIGKEGVVRYREADLEKAETLYSYGKFKELFLGEARQLHALQVDRMKLDQVAFNVESRHAYRLRQWIDFLAPIKDAKNPLSKFRRALPGPVKLKVRRFLVGLTRWGPPRGARMAGERTLDSPPRHEIPAGRGSQYSVDSFGKEEGVGLVQVMLDFVKNLLLDGAREFGEFFFGLAREVVREHYLRPDFLRTSLPGTRAVLREASSEARNSGREASASSSIPSMVSRSRTIPSVRPLASTSRTIPSKENGSLVDGLRKNTFSSAKPLSSETMKSSPDYPEYNIPAGSLPVGAAGARMAEPATPRLPVASDQTPEAKGGNGARMAALMRPDAGAVVFDQMEFVRKLLVFMFLKKIARFSDDFVFGHAFDVNNHNAGRFFDVKPDNIAEVFVAGQEHVFLALGIAVNLIIWSGRETFFTGFDDVEASRVQGFHKVGVDANVGQNLHQGLNLKGNLGRLFAQGNREVNGGHRVLFGDPWVLFGDLAHRIAGDQKIQNISNGRTRASNAGFAKSDFGINGNAAFFNQFLHSRKDNTSPIESQTTLAAGARLATAGEAGEIKGKGGKGRGQKILFILNKFFPGHLDVLENLFDQTTADVFAFVHRHSRAAAVGVAEANVAAVLTNLLEAKLLQNADKLDGTDRGKTRTQTATFTSWSPINRRGLWTTFSDLTQALIASLTRFKSSSKVLAWVWQPWIDGTEATSIPSSSSSIRTRYSSDMALSPNNPKYSIPAAGLPVGARLAIERSKVEVQNPLPPANGQLSTETPSQALTGARFAQTSQPTPSQPNPSQPVFQPIPANLVSTQSQPWDLGSFFSGLLNARLAFADQSIAVEEKEGQVYIFDLKVEGEKLIAVSRVGDIKVALHRTLSRGERLDDVRSDRVSLQDIRNMQAGLERQIGSLLGDVLKNTENRALILDITPDFLPQDSVYFDLYARYLIAVLTQLQNTPSLRGKIFFRTSDKRLKSLNPSIFDGEIPHALKSVRTVSLSSANVIPEADLHIPVSILKEGDIPAFLSILQVSIAAGFSLPERPMDISDNLLKAYSLLAGKTLERQDLWDIFYPTDLKTFGRFPLAPITSIDINTAMRAIQLGTRMAEQMA